MRSAKKTLAISALVVLLLMGVLVALTRSTGSNAISIGSKIFPESYVLAEITAQLLESNGILVDRKLGLGGTLIAYDALEGGSVDLYPEYTGTISQVILKKPGISSNELNAALAKRGLALGVHLGFNNSYAVAISGPIASKDGIVNISDLARHPDLRLGFSFEFLNRSDGWPALKQAYNLPQSASGIEHALAYAAIANNKLDATDAYTTDGELEAYDLRLLKDDKAFFPNYDAVLLMREGLPEYVNQVLAKLEGSLDASTMRSLNYRVSSDKLSPQLVASQFLKKAGLVTVSSTNAPDTAKRIFGYTAVHLKLTLIALLLACLVAIPAAMMLARHHAMAKTLLYITGLIQTVPALALLALLVPIVGLGEIPAIIALFLYSLLPIVRNTVTGLFAVDPLVKQVAAGMGMTPRQQLWKIELPLAGPMILAGVKTAAVISIGTATLAAFVGAGGLGEPIITGLTLNDHNRILEGAIPAALLAIIVELVFEGIERITVPPHLRN
ncbi:MAG: glycine betaine ABC transporter substrate-binding protein [Pseudomonadota bacterium]